MKTITVDRLPSCDFCSDDGGQEPARYDEKTRFGSWANMCERHHKMYGTGIGSVLAVRVKREGTPPPEGCPTVEISLEDAAMSEVCTVQCPHCGEDRSVEPDANYKATCEMCGGQFRVVSPI